MSPVFGVIGPATRCRVVNLNQLGGETHDFKLRLDSRTWILRISSPVCGLFLEGAAHIDSYAMIHCERRRSISIDRGQMSRTIV